MTTLTITVHDDPPDTMTIALDPPVQFKGGQVDALDLKEPTARQVREAEKEIGPDAAWSAQTSYELKLLALVTGLSKSAVDTLPVGAVNTAAAFLQGLVEEATAEEDSAAEEPPSAEDCSIAIDPPLKFAGSSYGELELREPLASEVRNARMLVRTAGSLFEARRAQMSLVTAVSGLPAPVIDALPIRVLNQAARVLGRFTVAGRKTGKR